MIGILILQLLKTVTTAFDVSFERFIWLKIIASLFCGKCFAKWSINPFPTNDPLMDKTGSWFLLAKGLKNTCGRVTF